jgi:hypothetical protein
MPRIAEFAKLPDGRLAVVLEVTGDTGEVTLWTAAERDKTIEQAVRDEREACAKIATRPPFVQARDNEFDDGFEFACRHIAAAIRNQ